jgi:hypothetical protein
VQRDLTLSVGHWNLHERRLEQALDVYLVDGRPLRTFHFAGFDPERPDEVTRYRWEAPVRGLQTATPALIDLCHSYAHRLLAAGYREASSSPYRYERSVAGTVLGKRERAIYRELVLAGEQVGRDVPSPFDRARSAEFERMLASPRETGLLSNRALERIGHNWDGVQHPWKIVLARRRRREVPRPRAGDRTQGEYTADGFVRPTEQPGASLLASEPAAVGHSATAQT